MGTHHGIISVFVGCPTRHLTPVEIVFEPDDVVLTGILPDLDLDQLKRQDARVCKPVNRSCRNEGGLAVPDQEGLIPDRHLGASGDHHPVLRPVVVHLER